MKYFEHYRRGFFKRIEWKRRMNVFRHIAATAAFIEAASGDGEGYDDTRHALVKSRSPQ